MAAVDMADDQDIRDRALGLIRQQTTMALATAGPDGPWAAPVYYVFQNAAFFFFSRPKARHITEVVENGRIAATIYPYADTWREIRGIQMSGRIKSISPGMTAIQSFRAYLAKYSFTKDFFGSGQSIDLSALTKQFRVNLYGLYPDLVYYLDNRIRFGFREEINL